MCQTCASGMSWSAASTMPIPARKTGTNPTVWASLTPLYGASGVRTSVGAVDRSAVAS